MHNNFSVGHRKRVYEKLESQQNFQDYEAVEMMLFLVFKRKDTKILAKLLLQKFNSLSGILHATKNELTSINGIGESTYNVFNIIKLIIKTYNAEKIQNTNILTCFDDVVLYLKSNMQYLKCEEFRILFLNNSNHLLNDIVMQKGTIDNVNINNREIIQKCIECGAKNIILVHNHISCDPTPSKYDLLCTKVIQESCAIFNINIIDHIIIAKGNIASFKNLGIL